MVDSEFKASLIVYPRKKHYVNFYKNRQYSYDLKASQHRKLELSLEDLPLLIGPDYFGKNPENPKDVLFTLVSIDVEVDVYVSLGANGSKMKIGHLDKGQQKVFTRKHTLNQNCHILPVLPDKKCECGTELNKVVAYSCVCDEDYPWLSYEYRCVNRECEKHAGI